MALPVLVDPTAGGRTASSPESFAALLQRLRIRAGLSQNQLARRAAVDPAYVNRMERGGRPPSRDVVLRLWVALETTVDDRERLLVAADYCPEAIRRLGWDGYVRTIRLRVGLVLHELDAALAVPPEAGGDGT